MAATVVIEIADPLTEESDYLVNATLNGPDGVTPVDVSAVAEIMATLRNLEDDSFVFEDRNVTSSLGVDGAFSMPLNADDLETTLVKRFQRRLLTLKLTQTNGKRRNHAIKFVVENLADVS